MKIKINIFKVFTFLNKKNNRVKNKYSIKIIYKIYNDTAIYLLFFNLKMQQFNKIIFCFV